MTFTDIGAVPHALMDRQARMHCPRCRAVIALMALGYAALAPGYVQRGDIWAISARAHKRRIRDLPIDREKAIMANLPARVLCARCGTLSVVDVPDG